MLDRIEECLNCGNKIECVCQIMQASDGAIVCDNCYEIYEDSIKDLSDD
jgi:transcription elongation factor Elf1